MTSFVFWRNNTVLYCTVLYNKSEGTDKVKTEGLKYNENKNLINVLLSLLILIWTHVMVPTLWLYASITCLYKKGRMSVAANYRGLSIGANMSRILAKIIISQMKVAYEMHISETKPIYIRWNIYCEDSD